MKEYKYKINGNEYKVAIGDVEGNIAKIEVNGTPYEVELEDQPKVSHVVKRIAPAASETTTAAPKPAGAGVTVKSPLPGIIISVDVKEGQAVKRGQKVAVIEAMKMENEILAESDGTVTAVHTRKGDSVLEGADIVTIG